MGVHGDYIGNRCFCLDIMSLFLHFKVKITVFTYAIVHLYSCTSMINLSDTCNVVIQYQIA